MITGFQYKIPEAKITGPPGFRGCACVCVCVYVCVCVCLGGWQETAREACEPPPACKNTSRLHRLQPANSWPTGTRLFCSAPLLPLLLPLTRGPLTPPPLTSPACPLLTGSGPGEERRVRGALADWDLILTAPRSLGSPFSHMSRVCQQL